MPRLNQQIIAEKLNLSQTTVSRALSNHPAINAETKAAVWDLAAQMGYSATPTKTRNHRNNGEPTVVGILISIPKRQRGHAETSQLTLRGIAERSAGLRMTLDIFYQEPSEAKSRTILKRIRQNKWKGCILIHPIDPAIVRELSKTVACVSIVDNYRLDYVDSIDVDQIESMKSLVRHLHRAGHREIGFASWVYDVATPWVYNRFGSFAETLFELGLPFHENRMINLRPEDRHSPEEVADLVAARVRDGTTAFVCAADHQAYDLRPLLEKRGLQIPGDCSLTGFDGIQPEGGQPQVATVIVPYEELGRSAIHQLTRRMEHPTAPRRHVLVDGNVIEGTSIQILNKPPGKRPKAAGALK